MKDEVHRAWKARFDERSARVLRTLSTFAFRFSTLALLAMCFDAAASDPYDAVNRVRAGGGACAEAKTLPPLKPQAALERVAAELARGSDLDQGLKAAGYRATRVQAISITGDARGAWAESTIRNYCERLQDPAMTEVGVYQGSRRAWIVLAEPFAPAVAMSQRAAGGRVLELVNEARAVPRYCGGREFKAAGPLRWNDVLAGAGRIHAEDMARNNYFSHSGRDGSGPAQRIERAGYRYRSIGENIAAGQMKPEDVVAGWLKSPGHCANLMNPVFTEMGVAFAVEKNSRLGVYWAQTFGAPR
jgi:uncharacterized protein YkwD